MYARNYRLLVLLNNWVYLPVVGCCVGVTTYCYMRFLAMRVLGSTEQLMLGGLGVNETAEKRPLHLSPLPLSYVFLSAPG